MSNNDAQPADKQGIRFAIDGAIAYGMQGVNPPPTPNHWLTEYWNIGRQLASLAIRATLPQQDQQAPRLRPHDMSEAKRFICQLEGVIDHQRATIAFLKSEAAHPPAAPIPYPHVQGNTFNDCRDVTSAPAPQAAWIDEFGNVFPLSAWKNLQCADHHDIYKKPWKPLFTHPPAQDTQSCPHVPATAPTAYGALTCLQCVAQDTQDAKDAP